METQLQNLNNCNNETVVIAKKTLDKENKKFYWKTGIQAVISTAGITGLFVSGVGLVPISIFSGSVIIGNILSIWAERKRRKNVKKFFQEWNKKLNKELEISKIRSEIQKERLETERLEAENLIKQEELEQLKLEISEKELIILTKQIEYKKIELEKRKIEAENLIREKELEQLSLERSRVQQDILTKQLDLAKLEMTTTLEADKRLVQSQLNSTLKVESLFDILEKNRLAKKESRRKFFEDESLDERLNIEEINKSESQNQQFLTKNYS
ncbi:MAG: hypothetical protein PPFGHCPK_00487 [Spiroplasma endosymbiont of Drosophila atripex]|nr:MAG: hypothetical protein PPFGHCPK_00487 [Spiroplasma endosymbiont of Drosophila atripex]